MNALNRLALGTVQFGMPYGVANTSGRVAEVEAKHIIKFASSMGWIRLIQRLLMAKVKKISV